MTDSQRGELAALVRSGMAQRMFPGAVVYVSRDGEPLFHQAFGRTTYEADARPVGTDALFDLASVTKLFTAIVVLRLAERGVVRLGDPVRRHVPEVESDWTVEDLLAHRTGTTAALLAEAVRCGVRPCEPGQEQALWRVIFGCGQAVELAEGGSHYSDIDLLLAQAVCERATGCGLDALVAAEVTGPLGLCDTSFCPPDRDRCAPTEIDDQWRHRLVVGEVHDEMAHTLGGVGGHAGLFATAADVGRFCEAWLGLEKKGNRRRGRAEGPGRAVCEHCPPPSDHRDRPRSDAFLDPATRDLALRPHSACFGLGWALCNAGSSFPSLGRYGGVGHLGFTGTWACLLPALDVAIVVLTNRVYPRRDAAPSRLPLLRQLAALIADRVC
ncbi:MAG: serine hydrolase domain-containing protein [Planctomycetota bacterium]